ncbi:M55 family metallopeptidase [Candidatus Bathyarchaeota archaeon]|nr:M55 family metallopeptidase [Candidatus Bathyarchaeota archaeon]MBL7168262.1 M55 family metallopeptidase [Candidatus Bathyarchaeota archaeon]
MSKPKSIYISIDMEGISGIFEGRQTGGDTGEYQRGRKLMIGDINAAVEGALEAGVEEIVVSDAHGGGRNLIAEEVHDAAYLIQGRPTWDTMMKGIGGGYDAALYLGYHAMKGTKEATLAHTVSGGVVDDVWVNGRPTGEFGLNAAVAGQYGVPSMFISGDAAAVEEAKQFVPNIGSAVVKWAMGRQVAKMLHPGKARDLIRKGVKEALGRVDEIEPFVVDPPVEFKMRVWSSLGVDALVRLPYVERLDGRTVKMTFDDYHKGQRALMAAITLAGTVRRR